MRQQITAIVLAPEGDAIFSERAHKIEIEDEAAGQFIKVSCNLGSTDLAGTITIECEEWPALRKAINKMVKQADAYNRNNE
jgi:hypothetical protein